MSGENLELPVSAKKGGERKKLVLLAVLFLLLMLSGGGIYFILFMEEQQPQNSPSLAVGKPKYPGATEHSNFPKKAERAKSETNKEEQLPVELPQLGNVGDISKLVGARESLKVEKQIADLEKQILEARRPFPSASASIPDTPTKDKEPRIKAEQEARDSKAKEKEAARKAAQARLEVVSVQGVEGALTAKVRDGLGNVATLRPGNQLMGGRVAKITRQGVEIDKNGKRVQLPFSGE